jgi:syndecan 4
VFDGFAGENCASTLCPDDCTDAAHGTCDLTTGICTCMDGFIGENCADPACDVNASENESGICVCNPGYTGNGLLCGIDTDSDGYPDLDLDCNDPSCHQDNCPNFPNSGQEDADSDGIGDSCDDDSDNDGIADTSDNCPYVSNADQNDVDSDGFGNVCV